MALIELERFEPEDNDLQGRRLIITYTAGKSEVDGLVPAYGTAYGSETGKFARVVVASRIIRNDPDYPGNARLIVTYKTLTCDEWLMLNPGKAVMIRGGHGATRPMHFHTASPYPPVSGRRDNGIYVFKEGEASKYLSAGTVLVHGYTTAPATDFEPHICNFYHVNSGTMSNFPSGMTAAQAVMLMQGDCKPVAFGSKLFEFNFLFAQNTFSAGCKSNLYIEGLKWEAVAVNPATLDENGHDLITGLDPVIEYRPVRTITWDSEITSVTRDTADFSAINTMLSSSWE